MAKARRNPPPPPLGARKLSPSIANSDADGKFAAHRTSDRDSNTLPPTSPSREGELIPFSTRLYSCWSDSRKLEPGRTVANTHSIDNKILHVLQYVNKLRSKCGGSKLHILNILNKRVVE